MTTRPLNQVSPGATANAPGSRPTLDQLQAALNGSSPGILRRLGQGMRPYRGNRQCMMDAWYYLQYQLGAQAAGSPYSRPGGPLPWRRIYDASKEPPSPDQNGHGRIRTGVRDSFVRQGNQWFVQVRDAQGHPVPGRKIPLPMFAVLRVAEEQGVRRGAPGPDGKPTVESRFTNQHTLVWLGGADGLFICDLRDRQGRHIKRIAGGPEGPPRFYGRSARIFKVTEIYLLPAHATGAQSASSQAGSTGSAGEAAR